ncbi:MAG: dihydrofolate reductase family protein [Pseudomonadales bacterium]|jgi:dihydrofolate reductase|nr:dihydrofolate reductase family protein [Pseudomonadales bacterium]
MEKALIVATTLDGYIAQETDQVATAWTSKDDQKWFGKISREYEIMVMGSTTYGTIGRPMPGRITVVMSRRGLEEAKSLDEMTATDNEGLFVTDLSPTDLVKKLTEIGRTKLAICGGTSVYNQFLEADLVDEIYLTIEPVLFGAGVKVVNEPMFKKLTLIERVELSSQTTVFHLSAR